MKNKIARILLLMTLVPAAVACGARVEPLDGASEDETVGVARQELTRPRALTAEESRFGETLVKFRDGLSSEHRRAFDEILGRAVAADEVLAGSSEVDRKAQSFSEALARFENGLPRRQREAYTAMLSAGALAGDLDADPTPPGETPSYFIWVHIARTAAVILSGAVLVVSEALEDEEEAEVPVLDLPDPQ